MSKAFRAFMTEAPDQAQAWGVLVQSLAQASVLDAKTGALAYLAVLAALERPSGLPFHVKAAKSAGATREEVISAILVGLPAAGHVVTRALPLVIEAYDQDQEELRVHIPRNQVRLAEPGGQEQTDEHQPDEDGQ